MTERECAEEQLRSNVASERKKNKPNISSPHTAVHSPLLEQFESNLVGTGRRRPVNRSLGRTRPLGIDIIGRLGTLRMQRPRLVAKPTPSKRLFFMKELRGEGLYILSVSQHTFANSFLEYLLTLTSLQVFRCVAIGVGSINTHSSQPRIPQSWPPDNCTQVPLIQFNTSTCPFF